MNENESVKQMFQGLIPDGEGVIQGTVTQVGPLIIQALNDPKLILPEPILIVPFHLKNYSTSIDITWQGNYGTALVDSQTFKDGEHPHGKSGEHGGHMSGDGKHTHPEDEGAHINHLNTFNIFGASMTVHNALKVGEKVHMLSFNQGKKYYVLDRVEPERKV